VYVVAVRRRPGRVEVRDLGGIFVRDEHLFVGGRDRTRLVHTLAKRADAARRILAAPAHVPVHGVLCLVDAEWRLLRRPLEVGGTTVVWPAELSRLLSRFGRLRADEIGALARGLRA
jgi:hypothetical protein